MSYLELSAILTIFVVINLLLKQYETRLVLFSSGLFLCLLSLDPMSALNSFASTMTKGSLITAICSAMGFAYVCTYTQADKSLVYYLTKPIKNLGIFLIPISTAITFVINIAIPSAAACSAAVGATLIPIMLRAGIKPAAAAASIFGGTMGSLLSPGTIHNSYIADMAGMSVMDFIAYHTPWSILSGVIASLGLLIWCYFLGDHKGEKIDLKESNEFKANPILAFLTLVPILILILGNTCIPLLEMGVAQAMLVGAVLMLLCSINRSNPQHFSNEFFNGMGKAYADVIGIIIAAGVFATGLQASGLINTLVEVLKESNDIARWGGSLGPWFLATLSGSADAATMAFNEAVTPYAKEFGMEIHSLGGLAYLCGKFGRVMSPVAGGMIIACGIAKVNPMEAVKRTAVPMTLATIVMAIFMV